jgi:PAS domain S-box-containing protein
MLGYAPQEFPIALETWKGLIHPADRPHVMERIFSALSEGVELCVVEYRMLQKDGSYRWIRDAGRVIDRDGNGKARRATGVHIDIDDKKRAEEVLRGEKDILEKLVRRRTAALEASLSKLKKEITVRRQAVEELKARTHELAEMNSALRLVLQKTQEERLDAEKRVTNAFEDTLRPILGRLKLTKLASPSAAYVKLLDEALTKLASVGIAGLLDLQHKLSPSESQVAGLILQGHRTKEIAEILLLSRRTIESHRKKIRRKLGLQRSKTNLRNYLSSLNSSPK